MKFEKITLILLILFIFSISAVSAHDADNTLLANSTADAETFADLDNDIRNVNEINITKDYKFDDSHDRNYTNGIEIKNKNLIINGDSHAVDGDNKSAIFRIENSNVIMNNLVFKNSNASAFFVRNSTLTTVDCVFEDNYDANTGGAVYTYNANYTSRNDRFENNYAKSGASLYIDDGSVFKLENGSFKSNRQLYWGLIYVISAQMDIAETTFDGINSKYTPAIYTTKSKGIIRNSNFINLHAALTGGAIGIKDFSNTITIDGCSFTNTSSEKNGGAIFVDSSADEVLSLGKIIINNTQFINCSSEFGGAILCLEGTLTVNNSNFTSNSAVYDGGAIYSSYARANILNSRFTSNKALSEGFSNGGAYYYNMGTLTINSTRFEDNTASEGSSLYSYDATLRLNNNYFRNPSGNASSIYAEFLKKITENKNNYTDDVLSLKNKNTETNVEGGQMSFEIRENTIHFDKLPSSFDLRTYNFTSPVFNQGSMGSCWAFGAVEALQSALIRYTNISANFSVNNLQNSLLQYSKYGILEITEGANGFMPATYFLSWLGISPSGYDTYDELGKISPLILTDEDIHVLDLVEIPARTSSTDNDQIKEAILKYGGVEASYNSNTGTLFYNKTSHAHYIHGLKLEPNHSICIVGWDDNYSKENFMKTPPGDGAFIVQNSWGTEWGENGFFYVSYYDETFARTHNPIAFVIRNNESYDMNYQHEVSGLLGIYNTPYYKNTYVAEKDGLIAAVGTFFNKTGSDYQFTIHVNGVSVYSQKGVSEFRGYSTIKLDNYIQIKKGDTFDVVFKNKIPYMASSRLHDQANVSFVSEDGKEWQDLNEQDSIALLKVYTVKDLGIASNLVKYYTDKTPLVATVGAGEAVVFELNSEKSKVVADENDSAKLPINLKPGSYKVTVTYKNTTIITSVLVKSTVIASNVKRVSGSNYNFKFKLVDSTGAALKNTKVKVTVNKKTSTYKTDSKGYVTIAYKKLTSKKKISIKNPKTGEVATKTISVASRFAGAKNIKMYCNEEPSYVFIIVANDCETPLPNKYVTASIDKHPFKVKSSSIGLVAFNIPKLTPGTHKITLKYGSSSNTYKITVKHVIKAKKTTTVKRTSKLVYKVTLKGKKVIKNKKVTLKLNGKKYTAKTNSKGIAKFTIKKSVISKLKAGKKYAMKITYKNDTLKRTLKIKR